jgi:hypothetical protein
MDGPARKSTSLAWIDQEEEAVSSFRFLLFFRFRQFGASEALI